MSDPWADRIPLNRAPSVTESAGSHGSSTGGSLDSTNAAMSTEIIDVTKATEKNGPTNPPSTWSADSPYKGLVS